MKFVVAVVMLALAVGVHSSLVAPGLGPLLATGAWGGLGAPVAINAWGVSAPGLWGGIPGISLSQGPGVAVAAPIAASIDVGTGPGVYVAKTRGAIHTAPLAGHINSATSLNLAPAPGTL
ncbi:adult cuticle protein 1-like [Anastrepha ludens]|uniref:adult cuticle protein 1-like n=1 Tax=Anastrepha ludens TaxID=28586 RepID=UPI0023AF7269|nr:adult cuticle protein 1-like [Anastrepha ludens]